MKIRGARGLEQVLREFGRIAEYQDEGERLYRRLRAGQDRVGIAADQDRRLRPLSGGLRAALTGLAMLVAWWLPAGL